MFMLLFVNKPLTFILYVLGVCLMILISFQDGNKFWFTSIWLIPAFSIFYFTSMTYYYLLRGNEKFEIKGVDIRLFKGPVRVYWLMSLIGLVISADPYPQVIIGLLQVTCPVIFYNPSKSFAIQVPRLTYDL